MEASLLSHPSPQPRFPCLRGSWPLTSRPCPGVAPCVGSARPARPTDKVGRTPDLIALHPRRGPQATWPRMLGPP